MAYCTIADIQNVFSEQQLIDYSNDVNAETVNETVVDSAIEQADGLINLYSSYFYVTPFTSPIPAMIKALSIDLAIVHLVKRRSVDSLPTIIEKSFDRAMNTLVQISEGELIIPSGIRLTNNSIGIANNKADVEKKFILDDY